MTNLVAEIDAIIMDGEPIDAELWEIEENLNREELTPTQAAIAHRRREEILVAKGLVNAKPGPARGVTDKLSATSYSRQSAGALGVDERTVRRDLARGKKVAPEILAEIEGTDLDKGVVLDRLAAVVPALDDRGDAAHGVVWPGPEGWRPGKGVGGFVSNAIAFQQPRWTACRDFKLAARKFPEYLRYIGHLAEVNDRIGCMHLPVHFNALMLLTFFALFSDQPNLKSAAGAFFPNCFR